MSRLLAGRGRSGVMSAGTTGVGASASSAAASPSAAATASGDGCAGAGAGARGRPDDGRDCADDEPSEGASDGAGGPSEGAGWPASRGTSSLASAVAGRLSSGDTEAASFEPRRPHLPLPLPRPDTETTIPGFAPAAPPPPPPPSDDDDAAAADDDDADFGGAFGLRSTRSTSEHSRHICRQGICFCLSLIHI